ncbi:MAG: IS66 family insertion sequence element accessory protein TnpB [Clostridia bacterium]|nr:IS66 family insertion sequence element accessory protein TnpB [Deltaproteobacteria bacterium]
MSEVLEEFVSGVASRRAEVVGQPRHHFYTPELIALGLAFARERSAAGAVPADIARDMGIHRETLVRWMRRGAGAGAAAAGTKPMRRVRIVSKARSRGQRTVLRAGRDRRAAHDARAVDRGARRAHPSAHVIGSTRMLAVYAAPHPIDLRGGFERLSAIARDVIGRDPMSGQLFLFVARNRKSAKVLLWDGTGLVIYHKRLSQGRFVAPWEREDLAMTQSELALFLRLATRTRAALTA